jgi:hypothetical protein
MSLSWIINLYPLTHIIRAQQNGHPDVQKPLYCRVCSANNDFPIRLWDQLLPQAKITINLMQASRMQLAISAYKAVFGPFDHNKTLLAESLLSS